MEADKYPTLSCNPFVTQLMRTCIYVDILNYNKRAQSTNDIIHECGVQMRRKFEERFGNGVQGTVLKEHETLGPRRIHKGIPRFAFLAMSLDPRFKNSRS